jgi:uncharacterized damage-inducible protein DinB
VIKCLVLCLLPAMLSAQGMPEVSGTPQDAATLRWIEVKAGDGPAAQPGQEYTLHYTGWLHDGTKFDSSVDRGKPFVFVQGRRQVIAGFDIGFAGMKVGGKRRLLLPYQLAYGEKGRGRIPPKADLIFDVELLGVKDVEGGKEAADVLMPLDDLEKQVIALAKAVPEEKYGWRPGDGVRSFREVFLHIAYGNRLMLAIAAGADRAAIDKQFAENEKMGKEPLSRDRVIELLTESFAAVRKAMMDATGGALSRDIDFFGRKTTMRGVLVEIDTHIGEHLGQLIAYSRVNGIAPPWSR